MNGTNRFGRAAATLALLLLLFPAAAVRTEAPAEGAERGSAHTAAEFAGGKEISAAAGCAGEESLAELELVRVAEGVQLDAVV